MTITLETQIKCVARELKMRQSVYPHWVVSGRMTQTQAGNEITAMSAVLETLQGLQAPAPEQIGLFEKEA